MTATMPTDAQARVLLKLHVGHCLGNGNAWRVARFETSLRALWSRGWAMSTRDITPAGSDVLARWLLRDFDPKKQPRGDWGPLHISTYLWLRTREPGESYATWLLRGLR